MQKSVLPALVLAGSLVLTACGVGDTVDVTAPDVTATDVAASVTSPSDPPTEEPSDPATEGRSEESSGQASEEAASPPTVVAHRQREEADERHPTYALDLVRPSVSDVSDAVAARIEGQLAALVDERVRRFVADDAEFDHEAAAELPTGELDLDVTSGTPNPHLLSVLFAELAMHQGAAHPWTTLHARTFDLTTGERVTLPELFTEDDGTVLQVVSDAVIPVLVARLDPEGEGWATEMVHEGAGPDAEMLSRFVVAREGLVVHFDQYQVGPGVAGPQEVMVAWEDLVAELTPGPRLEGALAAFG